ncbi:AmmeMemoRadiSam system protein A [Raoultibacter massiliensis]|uniref:AmmeMemoRadiSam system protein A n=1 Tax=Raoultibacter massiliensis TaxID=1852371 RepID=A0ABV1JBD5_9ACTN|nr:AmmeMemoRadiSam system protein A [Raoultibacter massiliensis]
MSLVAAYIVPHPPLAVPEVGRGEETRIADTLSGYCEVARRIAAHAPETILIVSPHSAYYGDWIYLGAGSAASGSLAQFGAPQVAADLSFDEELRCAIEDLAAERGLPVGCVSAAARELDHGMLVPLYYIEQRYPSDKYRTVSIGGSGVHREKLLAFGACLAEAAARIERKTVLLVSGDLSHKLKADGPYGFEPAGPLFDEGFARVVESGDPLAFAELDPVMCEDAAECGLSGFIMLAGALAEAERESGEPWSSELLSYEGPFGVGYGVAAFEREEADRSREEASAAKAMADGDGADEDAQAADSPACEGGVGGVSSGESIDGSCGDDPLAALARLTIERYVREGATPEAPALPDDLPRRAGCFVSIHVASTKELRGCIGTIEPVRAALAQEVIANAVAASTQDPRFPAITPAELADLDVSVDVLFPPEPARIADLDAKRFGVIVTQGFKRGLLLPDLEGVDTVEEQLRIACMKAGIDWRGGFDGIGIERFEVARHG